MKKTNKKHIYILAVTLASFILVGCNAIPKKPYPQAMNSVISNYGQGNYERALANADAVITRNKRTLDSHLLLLEKGKIALAARNFETAINSLQAAEKRFLDIEGTVSLSEETGSLFLGDNNIEYEAEPYEKLMISPYLALAYLGKGDIIGARVETKRIIGKIEQYLEKNPDDTKHLENPFARYLSALIYEKDGSFDDARIEYQKIMKTSSYYNFLQSDIDRCRAREKSSTTNLVVFVDVGFSPRKYEVRYGPESIHIPDVGVSTIQFVYPEYRKVPCSTNKCTVYLNNTSLGNTHLLYNLEETVLAQYEKNKDKLVEKILNQTILKTVAKAAAARGAQKIEGGALLVAAFSKILDEAEQADLRSWITLPREIQYARFHGVASGPQKLRVAGTTIDVDIEENELNIAYVSLPIR